MPTSKKLRQSCGASVHNGVEIFPIHFPKTEQMINSSAGTHMLDEIEQKGFINKQTNKQTHDRTLTQL